MEFKGFVERKVQREKDYDRFDEELRENPEKINAAEQRMLISVSQLTGFSAPLPGAEVVRDSRDLVAGYYPDATPWACKATTPDGDMSVSMRLAHNYDPDRFSWGAMVQLKLEDHTKSSLASPVIDNVVRCQIYNDGTLIVDLNSESDSGQPGSESWTQLQEILDEAVVELSAQQAAV